MIWPKYLFTQFIHISRLFTDTAETTVYRYLIDLEYVLMCHDHSNIVRHWLCRFAPVADAFTAKIPCARESIQWPWPGFAHIPAEYCSSVCWSWLTIPSPRYRCFMHIFVVNEHFLHSVVITWYDVAIVGVLVITASNQVSWLFPIPYKTLASC